MLRSLTVKLTLAFLLIGLTGALMIAFLVRQFTQREFDRFVLDQNQQAIVSELTQYYQANGSWKGLDATVLAEQNPPPGQNPRPPDVGPRRSLFVLADAEGNVVFGGGPRFQAQKLAASDLKKGTSIEVNGTTVGWLIFAPALDRWSPGTPEGDFLLSVNRAIYLSALAATVIALILGSILAYTLTRSLRELTAATRALAKGELGHQVKVRSRDELGDLAASFNQMSSELERSNELRRKMTADIAHDLRTPLSVVMGYTEALSDGKLEATPEIFQVMHTETQHLNHLVDDLKTLSLAEAGELPLAPQLLSPSDLLKRTAGAYTVQAQQKNISLKLELAPDLPQIKADVERMAQVLNNLMSNALRYTPDGGQITLSAETDNSEVRLLVADTGSGITADDLPFIFERSFRGDKARRLLNSETGLGLAIAKSLVEAQGGQISVESEPGKGTRFTICFSKENED